MNRFLLCLFIGLVVICHKGNAQEVHLEGTITDSLQQPKELANVLALKRSGAVASYGISDANGQFKLRLQKDSLYHIKVSYLGFETWERSFEANNDTVWEITLKEAPDLLEGVELVEDFPVTISGDTITYNADSFITGKEKKLENVLEQLPGFEVDEEGQIKVQGKDVSKVLVEGKEFFDGDTKMATRNIPANAVDKVQVLRDFNEVTPLRGVSDSDALALNVKLKEGKKNIWFGDISVAVGPDGRYLAHPNIFYYSPKASLNFIGDLNNIGKQAFTLQDYFRFSGGLANLGRRSGSSVALSSDEIGLSLMQNNRAREIETGLAALNLTYNPNKTLSFSCFGILSSTITDLASLSQRTYIRNEGNNEETLTSNTVQDNTSALVKLAATYVPSPKVYLDYDGFLKTSDILDRGELNSSVGTLQNAIKSENLRRPFSFEQSLRLFYAADDNNIGSLESSYLYKNQRPQFNLGTSQQPFVGTFPFQSDGPYFLFQDRDILTQRLELATNYYRVLNKTNHFNVNLGLQKIDQEANSTVDEILNDGTGVSFAEVPFSGSSQYNFLDVYAGIGYRVKFGKLTLNPSLSLHFYDTQNKYSDVTTPFNKTLLLPRFGAKYDFNSSQTLRFIYSLEATFADIQNLAPFIQLRGYNQLFSGTPSLQNAWYHSFNLDYYNFSMFNFTNINGGISYQKRYETIGTSVDFVGQDRIVSAINIENPDEIFSFRANYERRFPGWKGSLETRLNYNRLNNVVQGETNYNRSFSQNYKIALETRFKEAPNLELGFEKIWNDYASRQQAGRFITDRPFASFEAYFLKSFAFTAEYQYNSYKNTLGDTRSYFDFLNAALYFEKENSSWEFKLEGLNILNTTTLREDTFSENLIGTYAYFVQPRYVTFSITYAL